MNKKSRQNALLELIDTMSVFSQAELAAKLGEKGYVVTQASVSRDLDELGIVKQDGRYVRPAIAGTEADLGLVTFDTAGENLIVGRCSSGLASAITVRIDRTGIREIVGTIVAMTRYLSR
ncbi:MAG: hypothetical protein QM785_13630 [Pyrinomonadaceae bacterium]